MKKEKNFQKVFAAAYLAVTSRLGHVNSHLDYIDTHRRYRHCYCFAAIGIGWNYWRC